MGLDKLVLPMGALLFSWFAARVIAAPAFADVFPGDSPGLVRLLRVGLKSWVPLAILVLLVSGLALG